MATVTRKSRLKAMAAYLNLFVSARIVAGPSYADISCTLIKSVIAVMASQRLKLQRVNGGNCILIPRICGTGSLSLRLGYANLFLWLPVFLWRAQHSNTVKSLAKTSAKLLRNQNKIIHDKKFTVSSDDKSSIRSMLCQKQAQNLPKT